MLGLEQALERPVPELEQEQPQELEQLLELERQLEQQLELGQAVAIAHSWLPPFDPSS